MQKEQITRWLNNYWKWSRSTPKTHILWSSWQPWCIDSWWTSEYVNPPLKHLLCEAAAHVQRTIGIWWPIMQCESAIWMIHLLTDTKSVVIWRKKIKNLKIVHKAEAAWTPWTRLQFLIDLRRVPELLQLRPCDQCVDTKIRHARPVSSKQNNEGDPPSHHPSEGSHSRFFALDLCEKSVAGSNLNCMSKETLQHRLWPLQKQPGMAIHVDSDSWHPALSPCKRSHHLRFLANRQTLLRDISSQIEESS